MDAISGGKNFTSTQAATGRRTATIGMPIAIQCRNGTRSPPACSIMTRPSRLIELPAGVPTPPISAAIGIPIITARPKREPGRSPSLSRMPTAIAMKMAAAGTSETTREIVPVPMTNTYTARVASVPARAISHRAKRRARPVFTQA